MRRRATVVQRRDEERAGTPRSALAVEALTFDVGSTLLADSRGEARRQESRALKHWLKDHGLRERDERRRVLAAAGRAWSESDLDAARIAEKVADSIVSSVPLPVVESERRRLQALLTDIYQDGPYDAADGVHSVLRRLQARGIALGIVSNRGARPGRLMTLQLEAHGLMEFFDRKAVVWSDEVGARKPDPRIYLACLRALGVPPNRAAHVGDVKAKDVAGARDLGITTIRYTGIRDDPGEGPEADIVISGFEQLEEALGLPSPARARHHLRLLSGLPLVLGPATYEAVEDGGELIEGIARLVAAANFIW
jgi:putative hydrolase of the HAD superfamily